jgi:hypothetical protein
MKVRNRLLLNLTNNPFQYAIFGGESIEEKKTMKLFSDMAFWGYR